MLSDHEERQGYKARHFSFLEDDGMIQPIQQRASYIFTTKGRMHFIKGGYVGRFYTQLLTNFLKIAVSAFLIIGVIIQICEYNSRAVYKKTHKCQYKQEGKCRQY